MRILNIKFRVKDTLEIIIIAQQKISIFIILRIRLVLDSDRGEVITQRHEAAKNDE
ncbi:MAG: hypothetical protein HY607_01580 [Planctomycetes bacterium]|nr:hypothetical protein [Planctomycetota bacterium]